MKTFAVAILSILALAVDASAAAVRKSGGAFTTRNGRTVDTPAPAPTAAQAQRDVALALSNPGSGPSSNYGRHGARRGIGAGLRRADDGGEAEQLPPNFTKPGALIRTANPFGYSDPKNATTHTVQASAPGGRGFINIDDGKAFDVGRAPGIRQGAKDTLPPPNPVTGSTASGNNSITANSPATTTINNGAHDNQNGNSGGNGNGNGNGNGFGGGTGFDPSF